MIAFVTGSTGFLGSHLVERLVGGGHEVRCLVRATSDRRWLAEVADRVHWIEGDLGASDGLGEALDGAEVVFHCGGATRKRKPDPTELFRINEGGTRTLVEACARHAPTLKRFVLVSSVAALGPARAGELLVESSTCRPLTDYGRSKLAGEQVALDSGLPVAVLRPPAIYGPRDLNAVQLLRAVKRGFRPAGRRVVNFVHVDDCVEALLLLSRSPDGAGIFHAGGENVSLTELGSSAAAALGRRAVPLWMPAPLLFGAALAQEAIGAVTRTRPYLYLDKARELTAHWAVSSERLGRLGWTARRRLPEGLRQLAEWYRARGWI